MGENLGKFRKASEILIFLSPLQNDEIKTNPDLFSDTNSHVGSQCTEDGVRKIPDPDSASEVGELPQIPNKKPVSRVTGFHSSIVKDD
jgi:hypothetical protein